MKQIAPAAQIASSPRIATALRVIGASPVLLPACLLLALFLSLFLNLHAIPLLDVDEGAFGEATREMLASGNYLTTYLNGNLRFDKPILIYWLQAASVSAFGLTEFALRLPSALASAGWIVVILLFARRYCDRITGFVAATIGATALGFGIIGRGAIADGLLNLFLALAMFDIYRYLEEPQRMFRYRIYLWMGLGLLTKGPIALVIPFAVSAITFSLHGKWRIWWKAVLDPAGWAILLAVAGPWYLLEYREQGQAFIDGFLLRHNVDRFRHTLQGHGGSVLYYLPVLLLLLLPYSGLFLRILPALRVARRTPLATFLWTWFLFVLVFFSFSGTKLPHYLLYGISPLFILMAQHRAWLQSKWLAFAPPVLLGCLALALPALLRQVGSRMGNAYFREMLTQPDVFGTFYFLAASLLLVSAMLLAFFHRIAIWQRLVGIGLCTCAAVGGALLPAVATLQQGPVREAARIARQSMRPVSTWQINMPSFNVYLERTTPHHDPAATEDIVFTRVDRMGSLGPVDILYRKGGIALVQQRR